MSQQDTDALDTRPRNTFELRTRTGLKHPTVLPKGYTEPWLMTRQHLNDMCEAGLLPEGIQDLSKAFYTKLRPLISEIIGNLELAWRRGYDEGYLDAKKEGK